MRASLGPVRPGLLGAIGLLLAGGCGPGTVIVGAAILIGSGGSGGSDRPGSRRLVLAATYSDANGNGVVDLADTVRVTFGRDVFLQGTPSGDQAFALDPPGTFGLAAQVTAGPGVREFTITDLGGGSLQPNGLFGVGAGSSGLNVRASQIVITGAGGTPVEPDPTFVDLEGELNPRVLGATLTDASPNCLLGAGDHLEVTFSADVSFNTSDPTQAFQLRVPGDSFGAGAAFLGGGVPTNVRTATIVLGSGPSLIATGTFDPAILVPGSPSGVDVLGQSGMVVDASFPFVLALSRSPAGVDLSGPPFLGEALQSSEYVDVNDDGRIEWPDQVTVRFCQTVSVLGTPLADSVFSIVPGGTFGPAAVVTPGVLPNEVVIDSLGPSVFEPNGAFGTDIGSSGLNLRSGQTSLRDTGGGAIPPAAAPIDLGGEARPRILYATYFNANGNCAVDAGDLIEIRFLTNVSVTSPDPSQAFQLIVSGDSLGSGPTYLGGMPVDVDRFSIVLGGGAVLNPDDAFDPLFTAPGSPSGIDLVPSPGVVDALHPTVSAAPRSTPGVEIEGESSRVWTSVGEDHAGASFASSVASAGDVNGDGFDDVIVGAYDYEPGGSSPGPGKAYVYLGDASGLSSTPVWTSSGDNQARAQFGSAVASAGDVNNDGFSDIIVGVEGFTTGGSLEGKVYLFLGGPTGPSTNPDWTSSGDNQTDARFGRSVASAGDVDDDGFDDVIVGATGFSTTNSGAGKAYVYPGGASGLSSTPIWESVGDDVADAAFGGSVASAGVVNGDGFADIIVGASGPSGSSGKAFVYHGSPSGPSTPLPSWTSVGDNESGVRFGSTVASAGDVNDDGYSDVIVAAPWGTGASAGTGKIFLYLGGPGGLAANEIWTASGDDLFLSRFGDAAASAGDLNADGYSDIVASSPVHPFGVRGNVGKAYVYLGGPTVPSSFPDWTSQGDQNDQDFFGWSVASAGDTNGDGFSEIIIGAIGYDQSGWSVGKAYVHCLGP